MCPSMKIVVVIVVWRVVVVVVAVVVVVVVVVVEFSDVKFELNVDKFTDKILLLI